MRAARLFALMLELQGQGRMTAAQLAARLEVSERTVLRDVAVLSTAGVPIFAVQGAGGGIELLDGFRAGLATLTPVQAEAMLLVGQPGLADLLGLAVSARSARRALLHALPDTLPARATELDTWFLHAPLGRAGTAEQAEQIRAAARAIRLRVELRLGERTEPVRPLGLVHEAGAWRLVHLVTGRHGPEPAVLTLPEPPVRCRFGRGFTRPADFDLPAWWRGTQRLAARNSAPAMNLGRS